MKIVILDESYRNQIKQLYNLIYEYLENKDWFILRTPEDIENLFNKNSCCLLGIEENGQIVASSALYLDSKVYGDLSSLLKIGNEKVAEIGRCVVNPNFRGKNYMFLLNEELLKIAKKLGIEKIVASAHPDNISSNKSLQKLGMKKMLQTVRSRHYVRNVYLLNLKK